ncbi:unnamed protein product, partial [Closterium sp. NIES-53]
TSGMGLVLGGRARVVLTGHADACWVDDLATQRSSCCEAEIYVGAMAAQELWWLTYLLTDLGEAPCSPPVLYQRGQLRLAYVACEANTADVFTKALQPCDHQPCFVFLDWSCDPLFSPTLPMGGEVGEEARSGAGERERGRVEGRAERREGNGGRGSGRQPAPKFGTCCPDPPPSPPSPPCIPHPLQPSAPHSRGSEVHQPHLLTPIPPPPILPRPATPRSPHTFQQRMQRLFFRRHRPPLRPPPASARTFLRLRPSPRMAPSAEATASATCLCFLPATAPPPRAPPSGSHLAMSAQ